MGPLEINSWAEGKTAVTPFLGILTVLHKMIKNV